MRPPRRAIDDKRNEKMKGASNTETDAKATANAAEEEHERLFGVRNKNTSVKGSGRSRSYVFSDGYRNGLVDHPDDHIFLYLVDEHDKTKRTYEATLSYADVLDRLHQFRNGWRIRLRESDIVTNAEDMLRGALIAWRGQRGVPQIVE